MKPIIIVLLLFCQVIVIAQITFEEITAPVDFSMYAVRKSPLGEYFVQALNDSKSIYRSLDGIQWTKAVLPSSIRLGDIQFFSDGTPLLKSENYEHLIRRNGNWYQLDNGVKASFIKNDTLFAYQENTFGYSLDKGATFIILFTAADNISDHTAHLWKFQDYLVLHHTGGASDYVSVFTMAGQRVLFRQLESGIFSFRYNSCEQVLFTDYNQYYLLKEAGLQLTQGALTDILPFNADDDELISARGNYYIREGNTIYKSDGCEFSWATFAQHDLVAASQSYWINEQEDIFLHDGADNIFIEQINGSSTWDEHKPEINFPYIVNANEAGNMNQFAVTPNQFYHKHVNEIQWTKSDSINGEPSDVQYSPNGDLYFNADSTILYSHDNGIHFETINIPAGQFGDFGYRMYVLDNNAILLIGEFQGSYYTLNNGKSWIDFPINSFPYDYQYKLVGNYIYFVDMEYNYRFYRRSIVTSVLEVEEFPNLYNFSGYPIAIQDDGTIYFYAWDPTSGYPEGIFRYSFEEGIEPLPELLSMAGLDLYTSGSDLFTFTRTSYDVYDGETLHSYNISGLPSSTTNTKFFISENEHLFAILDDTRIFRSTEPLSYPQYITGTVYQNTPPDCLADTTDATLDYWQVQVKNDHYLRITSTNDDGDFKFSVPKGEYVISSQPISSNWDLCENAYPVTIDDEHSTVDQDFQAIGLVTCADLEIDFSTPRLRRCFENYYTVQVRNFGPEATSGTTLTLELDPYFEFISATLPYTLLSDSTISFDLGVLNVNDKIIFNIYFTVSCDAEIGTLHCLSGDLIDANLCGPSRSFYKECQENIGSFDPNDKRIFNEQGNETAGVEKGEYIYYHIRFQNTGTDTAFTVRIVDELSPMLDLGTLEMLSASHPYHYEITDGPSLAVTFDNILLPDSATNEAASNGFVKFRVKPLPQFDYGTMIPNQAGIFFDFNAPVLTNLTVLTIQHMVRTNDIKDQIEFNLFPNPTSTSLYLIQPDKNANHVQEYEIMDALGRRLLSGEINGEEIEVADLSPGIYTIVLMEDRKRVGRKQFVKI